MVDGMPMTPDRELPDHVALCPEELSDAAIQAIRTAFPSAESLAANSYLENW